VVAAFVTVALKTTLLVEITDEIVTGIAPVVLSKIAYSVIFVFVPSCIKNALEE
jgi:hypothetical protein